MCIHGGDDKVQATRRVCGSAAVVGFQKSAVCGLIRGQFSVIETARDNHIHPDERSKDGISYHSVAPMDHYMLHWPTSSVRC